jgi:DNA-binding MarR family transcriptional regulator
VKHTEIKARLALLGLTFTDLARALNVSPGALHRATRNDPFLQKLRARILAKLSEMEAEQKNQTAA